MFQIRCGSITSIALTLALAIAAESMSAVLPPPVIITVTSTADTFALDGVCTLREAISSAALGVVPGNGSAPGECALGGTAPAVDTIVFQIPDSDSGCVGTPKVCTIKPASPFPFITEPVVIDGYTQAGTKKNALAAGDDAVLLIELDATNVSPALRLEGAASSGSTIQGLAITHLASVGILVTDGSGNNTISGNFIGVNVAGTASSFIGSSFAVDVESASNGNTIGGSAPAARNVLSGNSEIVIVSGCDNTTIQGNYINIDRDGSVALTAAQRGIDVGSGSGNLIGGSGAGNVIGAWAAHGIIFQGTGSNNLIQGNFVGTDATGTIRLGGGVDGITYFEGSGAGNMIGGAGSGEGNLIDGATIAGVLLFFGTSTDLVVQGNRIGTDFSGTIPLGNANGIIVQGGTGMIGGMVAGAGNRIAFNSSLGVGLQSGAANVPILGNEIYANGGLGISLGNPSLPTPNDDGDADTGSNNQQNYPVISSVTINPNTTAHVSGSLNSTASTAFRVEFFANANCDSSGHGQGKMFVGFADNVMTDPTGNVSFGTPLALDFAVPAHRHVITATATDPAGNTSEFSACGNQDSIFTDGLEGD